MTLLCHLCAPEVTLSIPSAACRNAYRGSVRAFSLDAKARAWAARLIVSETEVGATHIAGCIHIAHLRTAPVSPSVWIGIAIIVDLPVYNFHCATPDESQR